jgi:hypothetical protein
MKKDYCTMKTQNCQVCSMASYGSGRDCQNNPIEPIKFTLYIPGELSEQIEFLRYKKRLSKNTIILEALKEYLPKQIKKYPEYIKGLNGQ